MKIINTNIIGMPFIKNLCPLLGDLYGSVYINGQPYTMNVSLILLLSDLFNTHEGNKSSDLFQRLFYFYQLMIEDNNSLITFT